MPARRSPLFRVARGFAWPLRRFFWPQFAWVRAQVIETDHRLHARVDAAIEQIGSEVRRTAGEVRIALGTLEGSVHESTTAGTESLAQAGQELRATGDWLAQVHDDLIDVKRQVGELSLTSDWLAGLQEQLVQLRAEPFRQAVGAAVAKLDANLATLLNYAESHEGFRAQRELWLNPPVQVVYRPGGVEPSSVNERIVEVPYVFAALHGLEPGARVLDVGSSESTVALSLASLGYRVTALDLRRYPLEHPLLEAVTSPLEGWEPDGEPYDAVVCLSSIEHFGVGAYGERGGGSDADRVGAERLRGLLRPGGLLALTVPYGEATVTELERVYDRPQLERLLEGWRIEDITVIEQAKPMVWRPCAGPEPSSGRAVALVRARATEAAASP